MYIGNATRTDQYIMTTFVTPQMLVTKNRSVQIEYHLTQYRTYIQTGTIGIFVDLDEIIQDTTTMPIYIGKNEDHIDVYASYTDLVPCAAYTIFDTIEQLSTVDVSAYIISGNGVIINTSGRRTQYITTQAIYLILLTEICERIEICIDTKWTKYVPVISIHDQTAVIMVDGIQSEMFLKRLVGL